MREEVFAAAGRFILAALVLAGAGYYMFAPQTQYTDHELSGETMGTSYGVKLSRVPTTIEIDVISENIRTALDTVDRSMSTFKDDSDVCRFNASDSSDWFAVAPETAEVVAIALDIARSTDGAFDITVAPLVRLWGFGAGATLRTAPPTDEEVETLRKRCGWKNLEVRTDPPALKKAVPELQIDLSGIAKGYAADQVGAALEKMSIDHYMVEIGGEVRCKGTKTDGSLWKIGIEVPRPDRPGVDPTPFLAVELKNRCLASSGDYRSFHEMAGVRYSHIIDPRTGTPLEQNPAESAAATTRLGSVSIIEPTCARADALATALFVLGEKDGLAWAEREKVAVLFLLREEKEDQPIREARSSTFPKSD